MMVIKRARRAQMLLEQPRGSWLLKLPPVLELIAEFHLQRISAHLIFWVFWKHFIFDSVMERREKVEIVNNVNMKIMKYHMQ